MESVGGADQRLSDAADRRRDDRQQRAGVRGPDAPTDTLTDERPARRARRLRHADDRLPGALLRSLLHGRTALPRLGAVLQHMLLSRQYRSASSRNLKESVLYLPGTSYSTLGGVLSVMVIAVDRCDGPRRLGDS